MLLGENGIGFCPTYFGDRESSGEDVLLSREAKISTLEAGFHIVYAKEEG